MSETETSLQFVLSFSPVEGDPTGLTEPLERLLRRLEAWLEPALYRLEPAEVTDGGEGEGEGLAAVAVEGGTTDLGRALELGAGWDGLEIPITYGLWPARLRVQRDVEGATSAALAFSQQALEPIYYNEFRSKRFFDIVADTLESLEADFCLLESTGVVRSWTVDALEQWLDLVELGQAGHLEWMIVRERCLPYDEVAYLESGEFRREHLDFRAMWVLTRWRGFSGPPEHED